MNERTEQIIMTTLAAYGLLKILEGLFERPRATVVVVTDPELAQELLADEGETK